MNAIELNMSFCTVVVFALIFSTSLGQNPLPDFIGFSYSKADTLNPASRRFISFLNEVSHFFPERSPARAEHVCKSTWNSKIEGNEHILCQIYHNIKPSDLRLYPYTGSFFITWNHWLFFEKSKRKVLITTLCWVSFEFSKVVYVHLAISIFGWPWGYLAATWETCRVRNLIYSRKKTPIALSVLILSQNS